MKLTIKSALIIDRNSRHHLKKRDMIIRDGVIASIGEDLKSEGKTIESPSLRVSPGWFDMKSNFCDPGLEYKEDILSGCRAAAAGGFTGVAIVPNTKPVIQSKNEISYVNNKSAGCIADVIPYGSVTRDNAGTELTEILDQHYAGAAAFTDGEVPLWNTDIIYKSLQYLQKVDGLVINKPEDKWLNMLGLMHEGKTNAMLGLKGMPRIAEEVMIDRDIRILEYTGGRLHFSNISTAESVKLIRQAKRKGLKLTCDIAAHQIALEDTALMDFDTNLKLNPPLREKNDIKALIAGIMDGSIDVVVSSHSPQDVDSKRMEFDLAEYGMIGLQTVYPILNTSLGEKNDEIIIDLLSVNPRKILGLPAISIIEGEKANLTLFDNKAEWTFDDQTNLSKSRNSPFLGRKMKGKVVGIINKGDIALNGY
ncbi:MAG TPA: dihydroorotase [Cyclobacteriaceae bacterium]|nr:dihydroorotase [Cyclobacteriaceae bacterium]